MSFTLVNVIHRHQLPDHLLHVGHRARAGFCTLWQRFIFHTRPAIAYTLAPVCTHIWSCESEQHWHGLLHRHPVPDAAVRHHLHRLLQVADEHRTGARHVPPLYFAFVAMSLLLEYNVIDCEAIMAFMGAG
ncbi:hypothetical protein CEXT_443561 [Caerostris extrusa]|uniref:Uncharacterized protein n=1 Tax=Caerostris extrusa TaxID=172846 RepID=A0AAV4SAB7_CAEEX|nr:hypothetical protein CEXT_443561 [Caerostris extrusa]